MIEYFNYWIPQEMWLPVDIEKVHKKVIFEDDEIVVLYIAKIDVSVIGEPDVKIMPVDHKTYGRWFDPLNTENQFTGYCEVLDSNWITVNKIGFQSSYGPDKKFRRVKLKISPEQRLEWVHNTARLAKDLLFCMENESYPMRRTSCGQFGGCDYLSICSLPPSAREMMIDKFFKVQEQWDPETHVTN